MTLDNASDGTAYRDLVSPHLLRAVPVSKGKGVVFDRLEVDRDAKRFAKLIVSRVSLANAR